jgi:hypothetical protein
MRQLNLVGRGVLAMAVVLMLAVPAQARTNNEEAVWKAAAREQVAQLVKIVKKMKGVIRTFGDGLTDPKP